MQDSETRSMALPLKFLRRSYEIMAVVVMDHDWEIGQEGDRERTIATYQTIGNALANSKDLPESDMVGVELTGTDWTNFYHIINAFSEEEDEADENFWHWLEALGEEVDS